MRRLLHSMEYCNDLMKCFQDSTIYQTFQLCIHIVKFQFSFFRHDFARQKRSITLNIIILHHTFLPCSIAWMIILSKEGNFLSLPNLNTVSRFYSNILFFRITQRINLAIDPITSCLCIRAYILYSLSDNHIIAQAILYFHP